MQLTYDEILHMASVLKSWLV